MQVVAVFILPRLFGVITVVDEDGGCVPVELFLRQERTALDDQDIFAGTGKMQRKRSAARPGSNDDRVVLRGHNREMQCTGIGEGLKSNGSHMGCRSLCKVWIGAEEGT